jgi:serine/threonine protein kinase
MAKYGSWLQRIISRLGPTREIESHYEFVQFLNVKKNRRIELVRRRSDQTLCVLKIVDANRTSGTSPLGFELSALKQLRHENIIRCNTVGRTKSNHYWFELQYIDGHNLDSIITQPNLLGWHAGTKAEFVDLAAAWLCGVIRGVHYMHWQGWVHGDLCPTNVMVTKHPQTAVVIDLEYARPLIDDATECRPRRHSLDFAAPEELKTGISTRDTDYYSVGKLGQRLFAASFLQNDLAPSDASESTRRSIAAACDQLVRSGSGERAERLQGLESVLKQ